MSTSAIEVQKLLNMKNPSNEPAFAIGSAASVIVALFYLVMTLFPNLLNETQEDAVTGIIAILAPVLASVVIRSKVWSPASVKEVVKEADQT